MSLDPTFGSEEEIWTPEIRTGGTECGVDAMDHIACHAERSCPEYADVEGENRGADKGYCDCPCDLADKESLLML